MTSNALDDLLGQQRPPTPSAAEVGLRPGQVTRSDATGVFVTVIGSATAHPLGPCRAATYRREVAVQTAISGSTVVTGYRYVVTPLPVGTQVLVANTDTGPWVVRHELPGGN